MIRSYRWWYNWLLASPFLSSCRNTVEKMELLCRLLPLQMLLQPNSPVPITLSSFMIKKRHTVPLTFLFVNFFQYPKWVLNSSPPWENDLLLSLALALDPIPTTSSKTLHCISSFCIYNFFLSMSSCLSTCKLAQIFPILKREWRTTTRY